MNIIEQNLANWQASLVATIPVGGLISRNPIAYKWKAPFRCWILREAALWRATDLLTQSYSLHKDGHGLGARILLRSGFETLGTLTYLNLRMEAVLEGKLDFNEFSKVTTKLVVGKKSNAKGPVAINVVTALEHASRRYPGLIEIYYDLSESAHPNYEGLVVGYSKPNHAEYETNFSNRWMSMYGESHLGSMELCMEIFHYEYNDHWPQLMARLESWIVQADQRLEATKNSDA